MIVSCAHRAQLEVLFAVTELQPDQSSRAPDGKRCLLTVSARPAAHRPRMRLESSLVLTQQPCVTHTHTHTHAHCFRKTGLMQTGNERDGRACGAYLDARCEEQRRRSRGGWTGTWPSGGPGKLHLCRRCDVSSWNQTEGFRRAFHRKI